jgi:phosphopantetheinyl transferase
MPIFSLHTDKTTIACHAIADLLKQTQHLSSFGLRPEEQGRYASFASQKRQHEYAASRHLAKQCLAQLTRSAPCDWLIQRDDNGAAAAINTQQILHENIVLSVTHSNDYCAVAASRQRIGIDLQRIELLERWQVIHTSVFSAKELQALDLECLQAAEKQLRFTQLWSLKEAHGKFRGDGLKIKADRHINFQLADSKSSYQAMTVQHHDYVFSVIADDIQSIAADLARQVHMHNVQYWLLSA